jgi:uncharacterized protein
MEKYKCDLGLKLYKSKILYEDKILDKWILFSPNKEGLPIIINNDIHSLLNLFTQGAKIYNVINSLIKDANNTYEIGKIFSYIALLQEKGFLVEKPDFLPYKISEKKIKLSSIGVWLHITNECNLNCSYCFVKNHSKEIMHTDTFKWFASSLIDTAKKYKINQIHLKFAGGEPTLQISLMEKFHDLIMPLAEKNDIKIFTSVLSNGVNLNKRLLNFLKRPNCGIGISIDGYKEKHNIYRKFRIGGKGSWDIIEKNIIILKENGIMPYIMATISKETADSLPDLLNWICENGMKTRIGIVRETNCSWQNISEINKEYNKLCDIMVKAFDKALSLLEQSSVKIDLLDTIEICELHFDQPSKGLICGIGRNHLVVKPNGNIVSCPMLIDEAGIKPDNDLLSSCKKTFPFPNWKRQFINIEDDCLSCLWYPVCAGGCPVMNKFINGYPFTKSPMCSFYKFIIPRYINFYANKIIQAFS